MDKPKTLRRLGEFLSIWGKVLLVVVTVILALLPFTYVQSFNALFAWLFWMFWNVISPSMLVLRWFLRNMWGDPSSFLIFLIDLPIAVSFVIVGHILKKKYRD